MMAAGVLPVTVIIFVCMTVIPPATADSTVSDLLTTVPFARSVDLFQEGKTGEAYNSLIHERDKYSGNRWKPLADFFSGILAGRLKLYDECVNSFSGGTRITLLADYSDLYLARCYAGRNEHKKALLTLRQFKERYPFSTQAGSALFDLASYLIVSGLKEEGVTELNRFLKQYPADRRVPDAYMLKGQTLESLKRPAEAYEPYRTLYYYFPDNPQAETALKRTIAIRRDRSLEIPITPLYPRKIRVERLLRKRLYKEAIKDIRSLIRLVKGPKESGKLYISLAQALRRSGHRTRAEGVLRKFLKNYPESRTSIKARYLLGKLYWNRGKSYKAMSQMHKIVRRFPKSPWAARALYVVGRIYEERGENKKAINRYSRVVQVYSRSSVRSDAVWRTGWIYYNSREFKKMISLLKYEVESSPESSGKDQLIYWTARAYERTGDIKSAKSLYRKIAVFPFSYYGAIAHSRLRQLDLSDAEEGVAGERKRITSTAEKIKRALELTGEPYRTHILKGVEFVRLGLSENADVEFMAAEPGLKGSLEKNMLSGDLYEMADNFNRAYQIRAQVLGVLSKEALKKFPAASRLSFFPFSYRDHVLEFSKKEGVDPLLILSVIRQESVYDPDAHSTANARGLMQIIPVTGRWLYRRVFRKNDFDQDILFDPKVNLRLGIHYLSRLLAQNRGDIVLAVATYNAGPRPVRKWAATFHDLSRDEFIEKIPYPETRGYVKKVLKNYENYRTLYPGYSKSGNLLRNLGRSFKIQGHHGLKKENPQAYNSPAQPQNHAGINQPSPGPR